MALFYKEVRILGVVDASAMILQVKDIKTGTVNDQLTVGRNLRILGSKIKIDGDNPSNGIYFINVESDDRNKVDMSEAVTNNTSEVILVIPEINTNTYGLEILTQFTNGLLPNEPRTAVLKKRSRYKYKYATQSYKCL